MVCTRPTVFESLVGHMNCAALAGIPYVYVPRRLALAIAIAKLDDARLAKVNLIIFTALGARIAVHSHDEADEQEDGNKKQDEEEQRMALAVLVK